MSGRTTTADMTTLYQREAADFASLARASYAAGDIERATRRQALAAVTYETARAYADLLRGGRP